MLNVGEIARVCHQVNKAYCESIGDKTQVNWEDAPDWQRISVISGVALHMQNRNASPSASHEAWMGQKIADGWKYGPEKNAVAKEHPCIVPFHALPQEQQAKDFVFKAIVHALWHDLNTKEDGC